MCIKFSRMHQHQMQIVEGGRQKTGVKYSYFQNMRTSSVL